MKQEIYTFVPVARCTIRYTTPPSPPPFPPHICGQSGRILVPLCAESFSCTKIVRYQSSAHGERERESSEHTFRRCFSVCVSVCGPLCAFVCVFISINGWKLNLLKFIKFMCIIYRETNEVIWLNNILCSARMFECKKKRTHMCAHNGTEVKR